LFLKGVHESLRLFETEIILWLGKFYGMIKDCSEKPDPGNEGERRKEM